MLLVTFHLTCNCSPIPFPIFKCLHSYFASMFAERKQCIFPEYCLQIDSRQSLRQAASASLHYTPGLHFVPPPYVPFRSLSAPSPGYPRKSASFIPLHSGQPTVSFRSPLAFPPHIPELKAKTGSSIPPAPIRYIAFSHHPCFSRPS